MKHFQLNEFNCPCCEKQHMDAQFLAQLDNARDYAGTPFFLTSGYRCEKHNKEVGSTSINHTSGKASDIRCIEGPLRVRIVHALLKAGFRRLGVGKTFIHVDSTDQVESIWLY